MNKALPYAAICVTMCCCIMAACHKPAGSAASFMMTGKANDTVISVTGTTNIYAGATKDVLEIFGEKYTGADTIGFIILLRQYVGPATYYLNDSTYLTPSVAQYIHKTAAATIVATSVRGTVNITTIAAGAINGTFTFTADDSINVTGGIFSAKF